MHGKLTEIVVAVVVVLVVVPFAVVVDFVRHFEEKLGTHGFRFIVAATSLQGLGCLLAAALEAERGSSPHVFRGAG